MTLPSVLELVPPSSSLHAEIAVPGSKSITNRALILAALGSGTTTISGALWSEDTIIMVDCLKSLGIAVSVSPDPADPGNRTIAVEGAQGVLLAGGSEGQPPRELFVGNAGTAARFISALVCLGEGTYRLSGTPRMHERPQAGLFAAIRELGYQVDAPNDRLPAIIHGTGPRQGARCRVRVDESSQFASGLLMASACGGWDVVLEGANADESPYVHLTTEMMRLFPRNGGTYEVEPDASSASYFWGADWLLRRREPTRFSRVRVARWMEHSLQIDARFPEILEAFPPRISRMNDLGDAIMTAVVLAPFAGEEKIFEDLGRLRLQECERVYALHTELEKCGAKVVEADNTLRITPGPLHGAEINTYGDHRMAMCFAMLGLVVPGIRICNPECVTKTFPNFFEKFAQLPPHGLGVILKGAPS